MTNKHLCGILNTPDDQIVHLVGHQQLVLIHGVIIGVIHGAIGGVLMYSL